jgi:hypothetical protein
MATGGMGEEAANSVATDNIDLSPLVWGATKNRIYAQLVPLPRTDLFTTYCGLAGAWIQILVLIQGLSTDFPSPVKKIYGAWKFPKKIKVFCGTSAQTLTNMTG